MLPPCSYVCKASCLGAARSGPLQLQPYWRPGEYHRKQHRTCWLLWQDKRWNHGPAQAHRHGPRNNCRCGVAAGIYMVVWVQQIGRQVRVLCCGLPVHNRRREKWILLRFMSMCGSKPDRDTAPDARSCVVYSRGDTNWTVPALPPPLYYTPLKIYNNCRLFRFYIFFKIINEFTKNYLKRK